MTDIFKPIALVGGAVFALSACATITTGSDQSVTIITDPTGATCELSRDGAIIAVANPTPATLNIEKSKNDILVKCAKLEHVDASEVMVSELQGMTFGNIIFGGFIGAAVDASSGASSKYPDSITIFLRPVEFTSLEQHKAFYDRQRAHLQKEATAAIADVRSACSSGTDDGCAPAIQAIEDERDAQLMAIDAEEASTKPAIQAPPVSEPGTVTDQQ